MKKKVVDKTFYFISSNRIVIQCRKAVQTNEQKRFIIIEPNIIKRVSIFLFSNADIQIKPLLKFLYLEFEYTYVYPQPKFYQIERENRL